MGVHGLFGILIAGGLGIPSAAGGGFRSAARAAFPSTVARAQEESSSIQGVAVDTQEDAEVRRLSSRLKEDAGLRDSVARRVLASSLARYVSASDDPKAAQNETARWIQGHPDEAARLSIGFAGDDRNGNHSFEESVYRRVDHYFELNPNRYRGLLGSLTAAGSASKAALKQTGIREEERRELIKRVFEGTAGESSKVLSDPREGASSGNPGSGAPAAFAGAGIYDRLSATNPAGYSPEVLEYQNALNARPVPGAPRAPETGRLDEATLEQPFYSMRFDIERLDAELRYQAAWASAKSARGKERKTDPPFERRRRNVDRAARALQEFREQAKKAADPARITPGFLKELGMKQKETARWITAAWLEEELQRLQAEAGFWSKEVQDSVRAAPEDESLRQRYLRQGDKLRRRLTRAQELDRDALSDLESPACFDRWEQIDRAVGEAKRLRRDLDRDVRLIVTLPDLLRENYKPEPYWRTILRRWIERLAPDSAWAKRLRREHADFDRLHDAFGKIAEGDFDAASRGYVLPREASR